MDVKPSTLEKLIVKVVCGVVIVSYEVLRVILPCKKKEKKLKTGISEQPGEFLMLLLKLSKKDWSFKYGSKFSRICQSMFVLLDGDLFYHGNPGRSWWNMG